MAFQEILEFRSPTRLLHGPGALSRLPELLPSGTRVLVVTDNGLREAGVIDQVAAVLEQAEIDHAVFSDVLPNPPASCVEEGAHFFAEQECGALLGVGGGSPMDVAKMIGVLVSHGGGIEEYLMAPGKITVDIPPLVCVPTTYGTGSEVTPFAVLTNPESRNKDPVVSWRIAPRAGILDAALCTALPAAVGGPTGMDALTHAIESYTNLMASPASDAIALEAMHLIGENLRLACANDHETEATQNMLLASAMAGNRLFADPARQRARHVAPGRGPVRRPPRARQRRAAAVRDGVQPGRGPAGSPTSPRRSGEIPPGWATGRRPASP